MAYCVAGSYTIQNCLLVGTESFTGVGGLGVSNTGFSGGANGLLTLIGGGESSIMMQTTNMAADTTKLILDNTNGSLQFRVGSAERMRISCAGNVGIGITGPGYRLHVRDSDNTGTIAVGHAIYPGLIYSDANTGEFRIDNRNSSAAGYISFYPNGQSGTIGSEAMRINVNGNVGIGTTSPGSILHIKGPSLSGCPFGAELRVWENSFGAVVQGSTQGTTYAFFGNFRYNFTTPASSDAPYSLSAGGMLVKDGIHIFTSNPNASTFTPAERLTIDNSGNVGIGTTSPNAPLHIIAGSADQTPILRICATSSPSTFNWAGSIMSPYLCSGRNFILLIGQEQSTKNSGYIGYNHTGTAGSNSNFLTFGHYGSDNLMNLMADGKLGIGTTSPSAKLHVASGNAAIVTSTTTSNGSTYIRFENTCNTTAAYFGLDGSGLAESENGSAYIGSSAGKSVIIAPALTERVRVTSAGNVGISCTSPGSKLTVGGSIHSTDTIKTTSGTVNTVLSWTATTGVVGTETNHALQFRTNDTEKLRITTVGDLGLGTTSPQNYTGYVSLTIGDNDVNKKGLIKFKSDFNSGAGAEIYQSSAGVLSFSMTGASIAMGINCSNNVGIGTISPSYRLHVNGTFYAAGSSIKYKEGICNYDINSCLFMCLKPVTYQYKDEWKHLGKELKSDIQIGLIAEDVAEVMPELAVLVNEEDEKVVRNVDYEKLSIVLLAEVQKLRREVDTLKNN